MDDTYSVTRRVYPTSPLLGINVFVTQLSVINRVRSLGESQFEEGGFLSNNVLPRKILLYIYISR